MYPQKSDVHVWVQYRWLSNPLLERHITSRAITGGFGTVGHMTFTAIDDWSVMTVATGCTKTGQIQVGANEIALLHVNM